MMRFRAAIIVGISALSLSGCVAAVFIPVAGGALLRNEIKNKNTSEESETAAMDAASSDQGTAFVEADASTPAQQTTMSDSAPQSGDEVDAFTRAISSGDYELVDALPAPDSSGGSGANARAVHNGQSWSEFVAFALSKVPEGDSPKETEQARSALLVDPMSLQPETQLCQNRPAAVLIDIDPETGLFPLGARDGGAKGKPALGDGLASLRASNIAIFWITDHSAADAKKTRLILREALLDPAGEDPLLVMRYPGEKKQTRRRGVGQTHCVIAIAGGQVSDFDELYDFLNDQSAAAALQSLYGNGWFLTPPATD